MNLNDLNKILAAAEKVAGKYTKEDKTIWTAFKEDGTEVSMWKSTACYSSGMYILPELEIHCLPSGGPSKGQMPTLWYHHYFRLLKSVGVVPPEVKVLHRKGAHCMIIPRTGWDRHSIYITLCYYRQMDQKPNEVMRAMLLWKRLAPFGTNFMQVLHYLAVTTRFGSGHYFMSTGVYGGADPLDLANGRALAQWARLSKAEKTEIVPHKKGAERDYSGSRYTNSYLSAQAKKIESIKVGELVEILDPKYAHLYEEPKPNGS